jgi:hypothetical protein
MRVGRTSDRVVCAGLSAIKISGCLVFVLFNGIDIWRGLGEVRGRYICARKRQRAIGTFPQVGGIGVEEEGKVYLNARLNELGPSIGQNDLLLPAKRG